MIVLSGADLVLPDRILTPGTLVIEAGRIVEIRSGVVTGSPPAGDTHPHAALSNHYIVPGFVDVHVHSVEGVDALDGPDAIGAIGAELPRYGVTSFCPTTVACGPAALRTMLEQVRGLRADPAGGRPGFCPFTSRATSSAPTIAELNRLRV